MKEGFHRVELNKTIWEVPERYINLSPVGSGAYGQVFYFGYYLFFYLFLNTNKNTNNAPISPFIKFLIKRKIKNKASPQAYVF